MATYTGTPGDNVRRGTSGDDTFDFSQGGHDRLQGKGGNDTFFMGTALDAGDRIYGGTGYDTIVLTGSPSGPLDHIASVEEFDLAAGSDYTFHLPAGVALRDTTLTIDASALAGNFIHVSGHDLLNPLLVIGGSGNDLIEGGSGRNTVFGGEGQDSISLHGVGTDIAYGGPGDDGIFGEPNDVLAGGEGDDIIRVARYAGSGVIRSIDAGPGDDLVGLEG